MGFWNLERVNWKTKCYGLDTGGDGNDSEKHYKHFEAHEWCKMEKEIAYVHNGRPLDYNRRIVAQLL